MAEDGVEVRQAHDAAEIEAAQELRLRVFSGEQSVPRDAEVDGLDGAALHLVAMRRGSVVGTCRIRFARGRGKVERMVVDPALRRTGIGTLLCRSAEAVSADRGAAEVVLHAQRQAEEFYAACGYQAEGETLLEEGIPHVLMRKRLAGPGP